MGTLFKRSGSPYWYAQYVDHTGKRSVARSTRTSDKAVAKRILAKLESDAALRREGVIDAAAERISTQSRKSITQHVDDFRAAIEAPGRTEKHVTATIAVIEDVIDRYSWSTLSDLSIEHVEAYSVYLRSTKAAARTIQRKLASLKQFAKWASQSGRLATNPLASLRTPTPDTDRRLERRALLPAEWPHLQTAAVNGPDNIVGPPSDRSVLSGLTRAIIYELAIQTGLRANELRELTSGKLYLDQTPPFVLLPSRSTKNKKPARQYVSADLADRLKRYTASRPPGPLFDLPHETGMAKILRADLATARAAWLVTNPKRDSSDFLLPTNHEGHDLDFHSLRHTCGAWLAAQGENPKTIQTIMRHSSITLTMDTYGHLFPASESDAIARLASRHFAG